MSAKKLLAAAAVVLLVAEVLLVGLSWMLAATATQGVRSLLSGEGLRWLLGDFLATLQSPWLVMLLLLAMAGGALWQSRLLVALRAPAATTLRTRVALRFAVVTLVVCVAVVVLLTAVPHAPLLGVTGHLWPSPFSRALVPLVAFAVLAASLLFGLMSHTFASLADAVGALCDGIAKAAPLFVLYVLVAQLVASFRFAFVTP